MTFLRPWFRKKFGPYMKNLTVKETQKYLTILRLVYFFSAGTLLALAYNYKKKSDKKLEELTGQPLKSNTFNRGTSLKDTMVSGVIYEYKPGKGMTKIYFDKEEYIRQLEEAAYQKAKEAQQKLLNEGQTLPEGTINLVET